ncbi:MAG: hypothetical protein MUO21_04090 [Nitrososphaeraceae archaeon]|nr:hypothetical protein [Nitrososphaeraceae archaeon]
MDLISVISHDSKPKFKVRICLNAAEIGIGAEIIDRSKFIREKINNRIVFHCPRNTFYFTVMSE